ncbi:MAG: hypothetical protein ACT4UQ_01120 [Gammaproteobacteria bacterium]
MAAWLARLRQRPFRIAHIAWAIFVLLVCVLLVVASLEGGHPPPIIFIPYALVAGVFGHVGLLIVGWLARRGRARVEAGSGAAAWPLELTFVALALAFAGFISTMFAIDSFPNLRTRPGEWLVVAAIAAAHVTAFVLLLLRRTAARWLLAAISLGWALGLGLELDTARGPGEMVLGIAIIAGFVALAIYPLRAARVKVAFR